jgi:hypothetical protein
MIVTGKCGRIKIFSLRVAQNSENNPRPNLALGAERVGDRLQKFIAQMRGNRRSGAIQRGHLVVG